MAKFQIQEVLGSEYFTVRLGSAATAAGNLAQTEVGKSIKLTGSSRYDLAVLGDAIEGVIVQLEGATLDGFTIGSMRNSKRVAVTFDGLQGTPGTGVVAIGDYVVTGSVAAKGTALAIPLKVCKATAVPTTFMWRVVANNDGSGAVGTTGVIERVNG